jgi:colanic acid/amylovoran biosynthesis glycosyltransferase
MSTLRIAIAVSTRHAYSETFIAAHEQRLKEVVAILSDGMPPRRVDDVPLLLPTTPKARLRSFVERKFQQLDQVSQRHRRTVELLRDRRVDVVLAEYGVMGEAMVDACGEAGVPLVAHFHGHDAHVHQVAVDRDGYRRLFATAAALVVVSRAMEQRLLELGAPREKVVYNCYGIDVDRFKEGRPDEAPPHFLAVGRFVEKKAPTHTLLAFRAVVDHRADARLTMVGVGPLWEACRQMVLALRLEGHVELVGVQSPDRIAELFRGSRAFVQHSVMPGNGDAEGTPLAVLEAMASGVPVVATRHTGIGDVVEHGVRGLLCAEHDVATMAANMLRLVDEPALAATMGHAGRAYVEQHHRVEGQVGILQSILEQAASQRTAGR